MGKKVVLWSLFVLLSAGSLLFTLAYFSDAFPLVNLDLKMDRSGAFHSSSELAGKNGWGPEDYRQAASFGVDSSVQTYVELEAGGAETFRDMLKGDLYSPYTWQVRHFRENETTETMIFFTPEGKPYGFSEKLPEEEPGAALESEAARRLAERKAHKNWDIVLSEYQLIEESEEARTGGRTDFSFVYERKAYELGEASYRLRLGVSGDKLTELRHFVKVPEEFIRSYEEMRSANNTIALVSNIAFFLLYILGGCIIGSFFLLRQRFMIWKTPLMWGCLIGFMQFIAGMNYFPIMWMNYDTAISSTSFTLQQAGAVLASSALMSVLMILSFMAAEGLTRKAFPDQIQLWRIWSRDVASTPRVAGYTSAGYLLISIFFAYEVILYLVNSRWLGWWSPSDALFDPDLLATYFPWMGSIANSAQAGFWEECLFRAVPLAGAALLGKKFGKKGWWIGGALILQAVIFGAAHANYPAQPAYARVVELMIPALGFGLIYLSYGLLPAIVLHYAYDVVWMSLPLFVSTASGVWVDRTLVIILALVPLGAVILARMRTGKWKSVSAFALNASWRPKPDLPDLAEETEELPDIQEAGESAAEIKSRTPVWIALAVAGLAAWILFADFSFDAPPVTVARNVVEQNAVAELKSEGVEFDKTWKTVSNIINPRGFDDSFVWREGGPEKYHELMGEYLSPPQWMVRFAAFEGDIADRAEEYRVYFNGSGEKIRYVHRLPEKAPGEAIEETDARKLADEAVVSLYDLDPEKLGFVSSEPVKRDNRRDWIFVYSDGGNYGLDLGEARIEVTVGGDKVTDSRRFVFVPEEWSREERSRRIVSDILQYGSDGVMAVLLFGGLIWGLVYWSRKKFSARMFFCGAGAMFILNALGIANNWDQTLSGFSTAQPFRNQVLIVFLGGLLVTVFFSGAIGMLLGIAHYLSGPKKSQGNFYIRGTALGLIAAGVLALVSNITPDLEPFWPGSGALNEMMPLLYYFISPLMSFIVLTSMLLFGFSAVSYLTCNWTCRRGLFSVLLIFLGVLIYGSQGVAGLTSWIIAGLLTGLAVLAAYIFLIRHSLAAIPPAVAAIMILGQARAAFMNPGLLSVAGFVIASLILSAAAHFWTNRGFARRNTE